MVSYLGIFDLWRQLSVLNTHIYSNKNASDIGEQTFKFSGVRTVARRQRLLFIVS